MSEVVNWGVLGYARIAKNSIIPAINRAGNARVYGVASRNKAELPSGEWEQNYGDYAALLADDAIQAVYIPHCRTHCIKSGLSGRWKRVNMCFARSLSV